MFTRLICTSLLCLGVIPLHVNSQTDSNSILSRIRLEGFGSAIYQKYQWQSYKSKRAAFDMPKVVLISEIVLTPRLSLEMEFEFEHGGTGSTMEFDNQEEFGEFEQEIEKGGEVLLEELELAYQVNDYLEIEAGRIVVPIGLVTEYYMPNDYFTTTYNSVESTLLPTKWYEFGAGIEGNFGHNHQWRYRLAMVNGLDATGFSSGNWILGGYQKRFETVNANHFAGVARLDFSFSERNVIGGSFYFGNSTGNRPKPDMTENAYVGIYEGHAVIHIRGFIFKMLGIYGTLTNAEAVSQANRNLSNNLNVKRTPVASAATGFYIETGYDLLNQQQQTEKLFVFGGYYYYDTMAKTEGSIFNNPRWERKEFRGGIQFIVNEYLSLKTDVTHRRLGTSKDRIENTWSVGLGFQF